MQISVECLRCDWSKASIDYHLVQYSTRGYHSLTSGRERTVAENHKNEEKRERIASRLCAKDIAVGVEKTYVASPAEDREPQLARLDLRAYFNRYRLN